MADILKDDSEGLKHRTKLSVADIINLVKLCLSKCYFLFDDQLYEIEDAGPIGLSLMVVMVECYLQTIEKENLP